MIVGDLHRFFLRPLRPDRVSARSRLRSAVYSSQTIAIASLRRVLGQRRRPLGRIGTGMPQIVTVSRIAPSRSDCWLSIGSLWLPAPDRDRIFDFIGHSAISVAVQHRHLLQSGGDNIDHPLIHGNKGALSRFTNKRR